MMRLHPSVGGTHAVVSEGQAAPPAVTNEYVQRSSFRFTDTLTARSDSRRTCAGTDGYAQCPFMGSTLTLPRGALVCASITNANVDTKEWCAVLYITDSDRTAIRSLT